MTIERKYADRIDTGFKYVPSTKTNIADTFKRIRKQQADAAIDAAREKK